MSTVDDLLKAVGDKHFAIPCSICFQPIPMFGAVPDPMQFPICEECIRRLRVILYPEKAEVK